MLIPGRLFAISITVFRVFSDIGKHIQTSVDRCQAWLCERLTKVTDFTLVA